jgi:hypothetical protein
VPHSPQNFAAGALSAPHCGQVRGSPVPHSEQNFLSPGFSEPQFEQHIEVTSENGTIGFLQVHPFFAATILYQGTIVPLMPRWAECDVESMNQAQLEFSSNRRKRDSVRTGGTNR